MRGRSTTYDTVERYQSTWQFPWRNSGAYAMAGDALRVSMDELAEGSMHATVDQRVSQDGLDASFLSREIAIGLLDVMTGYAPVVSTARDAYEAISGYDLISGEELDVGARSLAVLGVATLGMGKGIKAAIRTVEKVGDAVHAANRGVRIAHGLEGAVRGAGKIADSAASKAVVNWVGKDAKFIRNATDDIVILSKDGNKKVRFDFNHTFPHDSPHGHVEELVKGKWVKSGPLYPTDVPHK